jgi:hypothetical protein
MCPPRPGSAREWAGENPPRQQSYRPALVTVYVRPNPETVEPRLTDLHGDVTHIARAPPSCGAAPIDRLTMYQP